MQLKLDNTILANDAGRFCDGTPMGPANLAIAEVPGVELREFVGADRIEPEHVRANHGTISFEVTRVYPSPGEALAYALAGHLSEDVAGSLSYGASVIFQSAAVTSRRIGLVGSTVVVNYTIEG